MDSVVINPGHVPINSSAIGFEVALTPQHSQFLRIKEIKAINNPQVIEPDGSRTVMGKGIYTFNYHGGILKHPYETVTLIINPSKNAGGPRQAGDESNYEPGLPPTFFRDAIARPYCYPGIWRPFGTRRFIDFDTKGNPDGSSLVSIHYKELSDSKSPLEYSFKLNKGAFMRIDFDEPMRISRDGDVRNLLTEEDVHRLDIQGIELHLVCSSSVWGLDGSEGALSLAVDRLSLADNE
ncbi:uncharacterized protein F4822DRAFT_445007 [Hypoxylon trugodes]|uniref:uncharacterized protein n=1 Tax=Hypoxylon trugodes TaxID=326681 RepID=UPI0021A0EDE7|nr:uncharacterized protein F4822DRAFT_445007 [Hypoxylon trugodes]KAI1386728.1 hypothetical protein F4822DRAFT_445007 [Hypoxylon trugodes]